MHLRKTFTLDPKRYPLDKMRELVSHLHNNDQHYIVMVDPAVSVSGKHAFIFIDVTNDSDNHAYNDAREMGTLLDNPDGSLYKGKTRQTPPPASVKLTNRRRLARCGRLPRLV